MTEEINVISVPVEQAPTDVNTSIPPSVIHRNEFGLIDNNKITYVYTCDGLIDWRKMINPKFLVPNKQNFERNKKPVPPTIEGLEDKDLLILLGGIKELTQIRGYNYVSYTTQSPSNDYVVATCTINWIPSYETEGRSVTFSAIGDASPFNTNSFGKNYLGPIAENRAFVRAVRNFLRINIISQEEIPTGLSQDAENMDVSGNLLIQIMQENGVTFAKLKTKLIEEKFDGAETLESAMQIPKFKQFELIERIKKKAAEKKKS